MIFGVEELKFLNLIDRILFVYYLLLKLKEVVLGFNVQLAGNPGAFQNPGELLRTHVTVKENGKFELVELLLKGGKQDVENAYLFRLHGVVLDLGFFLQNVLNVVIVYFRVPLGEHAQGLVHIVLVDFKV